MDPMDPMRVLLGGYPFVMERPFTYDEAAEHNAYLTQDRLHADRKVRQKKLGEKMQQLQAEFRSEEFKIFSGYSRQHAESIWKNGIKETRERFVPAYCFPKFLQLPIELQLRVWSFASRAEDPRIHSIIDTRSERKYNYRLGRTNYMRSGSSRIEFKMRLGTPAYKCTSLLRACRTSRTVALQTYTLMSCLDSDSDYALFDREYVNTLYDSFYMGGEPWDRFRVLVDLLIRLNTTRQLQPRVQKDLKSLLNIRFMIVDFSIFAEAPKRLWAEFTKLESLTIVFYPMETISDEDLPYLERPALSPQFVQPSRKSPYKKRCEWITEKANAALEGVKKEVPGYKPPVVTSKVRLTEDDDYDFDVCSRHSDASDIDDDGDDGDDEEESDSDSDAIWYDEAKNWMERTVDQAQIKKLKHRYLPSDRKPIRRLRSGFVGHANMAYVTDSEAGADREPWFSSDSDLWDDEDW